MDNPQILLYASSGWESVGDQLSPEEGRLYDDYMTNLCYRVVPFHAALAVLLSTACSYLLIWFKQKRDTEWQKGGQQG